MTEGSGKELEYFSPNSLPRMSRMAVAAMVLGVVGIPLSCVGVGVILSIVGLILGIVSLSQIKKDPARWAGKGYALTGIVLGLVGPSLIMILLLIPSRGHSHEGANRSTCAANLTGITKAMIVYANDNNDVFPMAGRPVSPGRYRCDLGILSGATTDIKALEEIHGNPASAGNPTACLWMLVITNQISPKSLRCKSDPFAETAGMQVDASGRYFLTPQKSDQISYSITYPWDDKGEAGAWWKNDGDSSRPVMAEMAPLQGTGKPKRDVTKVRVAGTKYSVFNSFSHDGEGQNVAFADGHAEWVRKPDVGQSSENIFAIDTPTMTAPKAGDLGTGWMKKTTPFDTVMVPLRDGDSGEIK